MGLRSYLNEFCCLDIFLCVFCSPCYHTPTRPEMNAEGRLALAKMGLPEMNSYEQMEMRESHARGESCWYGGGQGGQQRAYGGPGGPYGRGFYDGINGYSSNMSRGMHDQRNGGHGGDNAAHSGRSGHGSQTGYGQGQGWYGR
ncbi:MAG: hypothetical protein Q9222_003177 [Ikaeria aurantiellina]